MAIGFIDRAGQSTIRFDETAVVGSDIADLAGKVVKVFEGTDGRASHVELHEDQTAPMN